MGRTISRVGSSAVNFKGGAMTQIHSPKRLLLYSVLFITLLLASSMVSAGTITVKGDLPIGTTYIFAYKGAAGGANPCSGTGSVDWNSFDGDTNYQDNDDYLLSWTATGTVDVNIFFCDGVDGTVRANYTQSSVNADANPTLIVDLGRIIGQNLNADVDGDYVFVCDSLGGNLLSSNIVSIDVTLTTDYTQWYAFDDTATSNDEIYVLFDEDTSNPCSWDTTKSTGRRINCNSDNAYENYCISAEFSPDTKASGNLHVDLANGDLRLEDSSGLSIGMYKLGADLSGTVDYNLYYDAPGSGTITMKIYDSAGTSVRETIYGLPNTFNVWDANIKVYGNVPNDIADVNTEIDTGITVSANTVSGTPYTYALYIPDANEPILYFRHAGETVYQYTFAGSPVNADTSVNVAKISGEAHPDLENAQKAAIRVFKDPTCQTEADQAAGDPNYSNVNYIADRAGYDYNVYFHDDGTSPYYLLVWYNDGSGDFNTCGNSFTLSNQMAIVDIVNEVTGKVPTDDGLNNVYIDYAQDGFDVGTDANTDDINADGYYHIFGTTDTGDANILFVDNVGTTVLSRTVTLSADTSVNVARVYGNTHNNLNDNPGDYVRVFSDPSCSTLVSSATEAPAAADTPDYNIYYQYSGGTDYYIEADANIGQVWYKSCVRFTSSGAGAADQVNITTQLTGQIPTGVAKVAVEVNGDSTYDATTTTFSGSSPDITYYLFTQPGSATSDVNFIDSDDNVLLSRSADLSGTDARVDVARVTGQLHSDLQDSSDKFDVCSDITCDTKYSSEDANVGGGYYTQYFEVPSAGTYDRILRVTNVQGSNTYYFDVNIADVGGAIINPGDTVTIDLTAKFSGKVPLDIKVIWVDQATQADDNAWSYAGIVNSSDGNYIIYNAASASTVRVAKADEDYAEGNGVALSLNKDIFNTIFNIDEVRGVVPWDFLGGTFEVELGTGGEGDGACDGAHYGDDGDSGGTFTITSVGTASDYDFRLYVDANGDDYNILACDVGGNLRLNRVKTASTVGGVYHDFNIGKVSGETLAELEDSANGPDIIQVYADSTCSTLLSSEPVQPVDDGTAEADYNQFFETTAGTQWYYMKATSDTNTRNLSSCIKFAAPGSDLNTVYNIDRKVYGTYVSGIESVGVYLGNTSDWNAFSNDVYSGDYFEVYVGAGTGSDAIKFYQLDNLGGALRLSRVKDLDTNTSLEINVSRVTGTLHPDLTVSNDNILVYNSGPATCAGLLSSEDVNIEGNTYYQYYESDSDGNVYIKVVDVNSGNGYETCIDTNFADVNATTFTYDLDTKIGGYVANGLDTVRIDWGNTGTYHAYSTIVATSPTATYNAYGPGDAGDTNVSFYSNNNTTKELEVVHSYLPNTTNMLNVGKVSGAVHDNADDGSNDLVTVWGDAGCSTTQLSSETEAAASQEYTQYFEDTGSTFYAKLSVDGTYNTCSAGFTLTNEENNSVDFNFEFTGTIPDTTDSSLNTPINNVGVLDYNAIGVSGTTYKLYVDRDLISSNNPITIFFNDSSGNELLSRTYDVSPELAGSNSKTVNVAVVHGETLAALEGAGNTLQVCNKVPEPSSFGDCTGFLVSSVVVTPSDNAKNDYEIYFEHDGNTLYFLQIHDNNTPDYNSYHKIVNVNPGTIAHIDLNGVLYGTVVEEYDGTTPIPDVNVELRHSDGSDWNAYTYTDSSGKYAIYAILGTYDLRYSKQGYVTRDWTTNPGEMDNVSLSYHLDTNLPSGIKVTVLDQGGWPITDATVKILTDVNPETVLTGCTNPNGLCIRDFNNAVGGVYTFGGFTYPQDVAIKVEKLGYTTVITPDYNGTYEIYQHVTSASQWDVTVRLYNAPPAQVSLLTPGDGDYLGTTTPTLSWIDLGVDEINYEIEISTDSTFTSLVVDVNNLSGDTTSYTPTLSDGTYYWRVRAFDGVNWGPWSEVRSFTIDSSAPAQPTVLINSGATYTNSQAVIVTVTSSGASYCRLSNDGTSWSGWLDYNGSDTNYAWTLAPGDGTKYVYVTCKNDAGLEASDNNTITLDTTAPTGVVITINDGAQYTNSTSVTIDTNAYDATTVVCQYSLDNVNWTTISCTSTNLAVTLPSGDGVKEIYFKATDAAGNVTNVSDTIVLDTTPPTAPTLTVTANNKQARLTWTAGTDTLSGIAYYNVYARYEADPTATSTYRIASGLTSPEYTYSPQITGTYHFGVTAVDNAGNESVLSTIQTVTLDFNAPTGVTVLINDGNLYTTSTTVKIDVNATGATTCQWSIDNVNWNDITCGTSTNITLPSGDGVKTVYVRAVDSSQNVTTASDTIILDTTAPSNITGTTATRSGNAVRIVWTVGSDATSGIDHYNIYRSTSAGFPMDSSTRIGSTVNTEFIDSSVTSGTYYYKVTAVDKAGNEGSTSVEASISIDFVAPQAALIVINGGAQYTNSPTVTLTLAARDNNGIKNCWASNDLTTWTSVGTGSTASWTLDSSSDGTKIVYYKCTDYSDNNSNIVSDTIILDTTAPTTPVAVSPTSAITTGSTVTWDWNASTDATSGVAYYRAMLYKNGVLVKDENVTNTYLTLSNLSEGTYTLYVTAVDNADNNSTVLQFATVTVDTTKPSVTFTNPTATTWTNDTLPDFNFNVSDNVNVTQCIITPYINGMAQSTVISTPSGNACGYTASGVSNGDEVYIGVVVKDSAGNESYAVLSPTYKIDTVAPTVTITWPTSGTQLSDTTPTVRFKAEDNVGGSGINLGALTVNINGSSATVTLDCNSSDNNRVQTCAFDVPAANAFSDPSSNNYITITVQDFAGTTGSATASNLSVDTNDYITINSITATKTVGIADNSYANGWRFDFNVTFGTSASGDKNKLRIKLDDWVNASNSSYTIEIDGNARMVYDANVNGVKTTKIYNIKNYYDTSQTVYPFWDHNPSTAAIDANFYIEQKIPSSVAAGTYYTTYYIKNYSS